MCTEYAPSVAVESRGRGERGIVRRAGLLVRDSGVVAGWFIILTCSVSPSVEGWPGFDLRFEGRVP